MYRTHTCGELTKKQIGSEVTLSGWVNTARDHGGVIFIDLRDRYGITQIKADPATAPADLVELAQSAKSEYVLQVTGNVVERPEGTINTNLPTGEVEIVPTELKILSKSDLPPFEIDNEHNVREEVRMAYRYLDLRRETPKNNLIARANIMHAISDFYRENNFLYVETPSLLKNTPEGAREYVVPSRNSKGKGYVLPQSPQQLKQILMVSGFDRYYQVAKCFRDEDLRGDRQPEFTQIDVEMSFVTQEDIISLHQNMFNTISKNLYPNKKILNEDFPVMTYHQAMEKYGIDKPELRTQELSLVDVSDIAAKSELKVFGDVVAGGGCVKGIVANKIFSRGEVDKLTKKLQEKGAKGLAYIIWDDEGPKSPILKFFSEDLQKELFEKIGAKPGTTSFFQATSWLEATSLLGYLRTILIEQLELTKGKENELAYGWIVDFPMFEIDEDGKFNAMHHPFTKPKDEYIPLMIEMAAKIKAGEKLSEQDYKALLDVKADAYDLCLNGYEVAGGSIRISDSQLQDAVLTLLGLSEKEISERFGHMLKAFSYGVPPHGGIATGFDRLVMVLQNTPNIREVIAFPKTQKGEDLMLQTPSEIDPKLLKELGLKLIADEE